MKDQLEALVSQMIEHDIGFEDAVAEFERRFIKRVLEKSNGNQSRASERLGLQRTYLSRLIKNLDMR